MSTQKIAKRIKMSEIYNTTILGHSIMENAIIEKGKASL